MEFLCKIFLLGLMTQACLGVRVTLQDGRSGTVETNAARGSSVTLSCSASASINNGAPRLEWTYDTSPNSAGTHLVDSGIVVEGTDPDISVTSPYSLTIANLQSSDSGFYTCRVTIPRDVPSVDFAKYNFTVHVPPDERISCGFPTDLMLPLGQSASFHCREVTPQAVPSPTFTWYKNGVQLPEASTGIAAYSNSSFSYSQRTGVLNFASVVKGDAGTYYCKAGNVLAEFQCPSAAIKTKEVNVGAIVGIVFGVIFAMILIGVLIWWTWRKGYCEGFFGKDEDEEAPDDGANDIMLDGVGPLVTKEPSEWSNGTPNKGSVHSSGRRMPEGAVRVMP